ncbi:class III poly(R)-hydroxyalkanoic acid synthase subunit PhaC [Candidatus Solincola tengchongensis]|uniref:class III poly(R)-hydroxyalkanoic acid synthase subunit PhaC n=1 Tax=Candidatus Solincola tengchongensis TaxID=2900693 RepID=UPI00258052DF|nr:class III poly(R)-hydroxyalkanoic acid synthase subunit PhaC [Candidatus Solincola tengchongensis]
MFREFLDPKFFLQELEEVNRKVVKGAEILLSIPDVDVEPTPKELVFEEDKVRLYHYLSEEKPRCPVPILICYALVNRQYMMDLQSDRSLIRNLLGEGLDIYIIDWGYPDHGDRYVTLEDYIDVYLNDCVDLVRRRSGHERINLLGVCQGGTFSVIYSALYPEKIRNLITMVTPVDFHVTDGLLNVWSQHMDVDKMVDTMGIIPGEFMNVGFLMLRPFQLLVDKYVGLMDNLDDPATVANFVRMEKWIFDSPAQAGEAYRKFLKDLYQQNKLVKGELEIGGRRVDLARITMPLLNIYATEDHLVPPVSSIPLNDLVGSEDKTLYGFPGGHIGIYVSSRSQKELAPMVSKWVMDRCREAVREGSGRGRPRKKSSAAGKVSRAAEASSARGGGRGSERGARGGTGKKAGS